MRDDAESEAVFSSATDQPGGPKSTGPAGQGRPDRTPGLRAAVLLFSVGVLSVVLSGTGVLLLRERNAQWDRAEERVASINLALTELTRGIILGASDPLDSLAQRQLSVPALRREAEVLVDRASFLSDVVVVGGDGRVIVSTNTGFPSGSRAFGSAHRDIWNQTVALSPSVLPTVLTPVDGGVPRFAVVRPFSPTQSGVPSGGLIVGLIAGDPFVALLGAADLGREGRFAVYDDAGVLLAHFPSRGDRIGESFAKGPLFSAIQSGWAVGTIRSEDMSDDDPRVIAYRVLSQPPIVLTAGLGQDDALAPWHQALPVFAAFGAAILASILVLVGLIFRQVGLADRMREDVISSRNRFRSFFDGAFEGMLVLKEGRVSDANPAAAAILGRPADSLVGWTLISLVSEADRPIVERKLSLIRDITPATIRMKHVDGSTRPVEMRLRDDLGAGMPSDPALRMVAIQDISERLRVEDRMRRLTAFDPLTECYNRRAFLDLAEAEFQRYRRYGRTMSLLMIDPDDLRTINATHGHLVGDEVLRHLVARCGHIMRSSDFVGRFGGEEFAILLPETPISGAVRMGERLCKDVVRHPVVQTGSDPKKIRYTVSIGVSEATPKDASVDAILSRADKAVQTAKASGGNRVERGVVAATS